MPEILITDNPSTKWAKEVNNRIERSQLVHSDDFTISKDSRGTRIHLKKRLKPSNEYIKPAGEFNPSSAYEVNDFVRVLPNKTYQDYLGNNVPCVPGSWLCVAPVPSQKFTDVFQGNTQQFAQYLRQPGITYYPTLPEAPFTASLKNLDGRYWEAWPPLVTQPGCDSNGNNVTVYEAVYVSGSLSN